MKKLNEIQQKLKAPKNQRNSFGNYNYRSCEDILETVKPLLCEATLTISDEIVMLGERFYVKATVTLKDDKEEVSVSAYARESLDKKGMDSAQITGAASSYARKYALNGLFCIDDTKDADTQDNTKTTQGMATQKANTYKKSPLKKAEGMICKLCKAEAVISPKTGNPFCPNFQEHKKKGEYGEIIKKPTESDIRFDEDLEATKDEVPF